MRSQSFERIDAILSRHVPLYDVCIRDLRTGEEARLGTQRPYPIQSCFKLAVMVAALEVLEPGEFERPIAIAPERFSAGAGVLKYLDSTVTMTPLQLIQLMLSTSDATATDVLIDRMGIERVNATLGRLAPGAHIACGLDEMIARFYAIPGATDCKTRTWSQAELATFTDRACELGAADAGQLASLVGGSVALSVRREHSSPSGRSLSVDGRFPPRLTAYVGGGARTFCKTGSLGFCFFCADTVAVLDGPQVIATYALTSAGWRLPAGLVDAVIAIAGLEILRCLCLDPTPNQNWTAEGEALLTGGL